MITKYLAAALLGTAILCAPALAQAPAKSPDAKVSSTNNQANSGEWRSSKLIGVNVYNDNNEKIGDISDLLVDQTGKIQAVVLGVGGFLGMGEHLVAVKFEQLKWLNEPARTAANTPAPNANTNTRATTGSSVPARSADNADRMYPDHAVLNATKDQLKSMPEFKYPK